MKSTTLPLLVLLLIGSSYTSVFAQFTASNFKFVGLDAKRRAKTADAFPQKPLKQIEFSMEIAAIEKSDTALTRGAHEIHLVLTAPDGETIVNLNSNQSNIPFNYQGKSMISTTKSFIV